MKVLKITSDKELNTAIKCNTLEYDGDIEIYIDVVDPQLDIITRGHMSAKGNIFVNNINVGGNVSVNNVSANNVSANNVSATGDISANNVSATGNISARNIRTDGNISATGNISAHNIRADGYIRADGCLSARYIFFKSIYGMQFSMLKVEAVLPSTGNNDRAMWAARLGIDTSNGCWKEFVERLSVVAESLLEQKDKWLPVETIMLKSVLGHYRDTDLS